MTFRPMTDISGKDLKEAFNINDGLEEAPSPPGQHLKPKLEAQINSESDGSDSDDNDPGVVQKVDKH